MNLGLTDKKIFLIAGDGNLPLQIYQQLTQKTKNIYIFSTHHDPDSFPSCIYYKKCQLRDIGALFSQFKKYKPEYFIMSGGVKFNGVFEVLRGLIFHPIYLFKIVKLLKTVQIKGDDGYLNVLHTFIEKEFNAKILSTFDVDKNLTTFNDVNASIFEDYKKDAQLGFDLINTISKFDVGQSVVIQEQRVIAIEAQEGTENLIRRSVELFLNSKQKPILVKKTKINQNLAVDLPTIGIKTVQDCYQNGFDGIVIEKNKTIVLNQEEIVEFLTNKKFFIVSL